MEIVRAAFDAFNRGEVDAALKDAAPSFEYDFSRSRSPGRGIYSLDQMPDYFKEFAGTWESVRLGPDEFIDAGEHVVTPFTNQFRGRDGIEVILDPEKAVEEAREPDEAAEGDRVEEAEPPDVALPQHRRTQTQFVPYATTDPWADALRESLEIYKREHPQSSAPDLILARAEKLYAGKTAGQPRG